MFMFFFFLLSSQAFLLKLHFSNVLLEVKETHECAVWNHQHVQNIWGTLKALLGSDDNCQESF